MVKPHKQRLSSMSNQQKAENPTRSLIRMKEKVKGTHENDGNLERKRRNQKVYY
jgi:hypothetical protein